MKHGATSSDAYEAPSVAPELEWIYKTAPIGLAFLSTDCRYVMINEHLTEICGISIAEHIGRSVRQTVPQVAEQVEQIVAAIRRTGEPITGIEVNGQRPDGSNTERVWITYWHPLKGQDGEVVGINVAAEEITERKRAEAELAASREYLRQLNETLAERVEAQAQERDRIWRLSRDLLVVTDTQANILNVNPAWTATLGWHAEELIGRNLERLIHTADRERSHAELAGLMAGRNTGHVESRMASKGGAYRLLSWLAVQDRGQIYAAGRDITDLREAQEQLHSLRRQLAEASRQMAMGAMAASIAHEINQPLGAVVANANAGLRFLARKPPDLVEIEEALGEIVKAGHRAGEVIGGIRAMFTKGPQERACVDVNDVVREVLALLHRELQDHSISVRTILFEGLPRVAAIRVQLQQVVLNLLNNGIEAMNAMGREARLLRVSSELRGAGNIRVVVEDSGPGIAPENLGHIFDAFFTTKPTGMGMGLSICRSIIEAHGGRLSASHAPGGGTIFEIALPAVELSKVG
jgi:PAS domain S-box-containing protein